MPYPFLRDCVVSVSLEMKWKEFIILRSGGFLYIIFSIEESHITKCSFRSLSELRSSWGYMLHVYIVSVSYVGSNKLIGMEGH